MNFTSGNTVWRARSKAVQWVIQNRSQNATRKTALRTSSCVDFVDHNKAFDCVQTEATIKALATQVVPIQYVRLLRELYSEFKTKISSFYNDVVVSLKIKVWQGNTTFSKLCALENIMRVLEQEA